MKSYQNKSSIVLVLIISPLMRVPGHVQYRFQEHFSFFLAELFSVISDHDDIYLT